MNEINVNQLLTQMRAMAERTEALPPISQADQTSDFSSLLKTSIDKVNEVSMHAGEMAQRFDAGDKNVALSDVMISLQKANVSFQAMTHVRNRLVTAYQDIMNMQI